MAEMKFTRRRFAAAAIILSLVFIGFSGAIAQLVLQNRHAALESTRLVGEMITLQTEQAGSHAQAELMQSQSTQQAEYLLGLETEISNLKMSNSAMAESQQKLLSQLAVLETENALKDAEIIALVPQANEIVPTAVSLDLPRAPTEAPPGMLTMNVPRNGHTATSLSNGKVLLVSGNTFLGTDTNSAEIFDPVANSFSFTGSLNTARTGHTATLLPDGRVLVIAGYGGGSWLSSAEIFDPLSQTWSINFPVFNHGVCHTATSLADGRVLVMGGANQSGPAGPDDRVEIFDPYLNSWYSVDVHLNAEACHTATLLNDGNVLVAGGVAEPEIFNVAQMLWKPAGSLITPRWNSAAVRLSDGRILLIGGRPIQPPEESALSSVEIYNPATNTWRFTAPMNQARYFHTAVLLRDGRVMVVGGWNSLNSYEAGVSSSVEIFDPKIETWSILAGYEIGRVNHTATLLKDGRVLITGGEFRYGEYLNTIAIIAP